MWIRSQDSKRLLKVRNIVMKEYNEDIHEIDYFIIYSVEDRLSLELGTYSTKEKALKVMQQLENQCNTVEEFKAQGIRGDSKSNYRLMKFVFKMPIDDEV